MTALVDSTDRAARGGRAGALRVAVVDAGGIFVGRVSEAFAERLAGACRGHLSAACLRLAPGVRIPRAVSDMRAIERARRKATDPMIRRGLQGFDNTRLVEARR